MVRRIISAIILAPLFIGVIYLGGYYLKAVIAVLAILGLREYLRLGRKSGWVTSEVWPMSLCAIWMCLFLIDLRSWLLPALYLCFFLLILRFVLSYPRMEYTELLFQLTAFFYPVVFFTYLGQLRVLQNGFEWCLLAVLTVWLTDSAAYFIGSAFGKHKYAPSLSPNKSWEGAVAGVFVAAVFGLIFGLWTEMAPLWLFLLITVGVSLTAQIGDLFESALKRAAKVKDSGRAIPGHGGILDRFDSFLLAIPFAYYALTVYYTSLL
jgi:phosphatidate cytidylyltransferase